MLHHLGGFTSKGNKCHKDCFTKFKCSQRLALSIHHLVFLTNHTFLTKRDGESSTRLMNDYFRGWHQQSLKEGGEKLLYLSQKLANKNKNIRNLKTSRWMNLPNRTLRFEKPDHPVFLVSVRCGVCVTIMFHSSQLVF
jgi:hypothetical protein